MCTALQRMTPLQALQMQLQLQQQMAGQQNYGNSANGLERFFQLNAAQRAAGLPAQVRNGLALAAAFFRGSFLSGSLDVCACAWVCILSIAFGPHC